MSKVHHYCYRIDFETGHVYYGVRSCKCSPKDDNGYLGSPVRHKDYWSKHKPKKTILKEFDTRLEAEEAEKFLINWQWNAIEDGMKLSLNGCIANIAFNGFGYKWTEEQRKRRTWPRGKGHPNYGRKASEETRKKISKSHKGIKQTKESKQKISETLRGEGCYWYGKHLSDKHKEKVRAANLGNTNRAKKYNLKSPEGEVIEIFNMAKFCRENNLSKSHMYSVARGDRKQHKGWTKAKN